MATYQQQMLKFHQQVRTAQEELLAKTKKKIEMFKRDLKAKGLDDNDKVFLEANISKLENDVRIYKELIAQTRRKK